MRTGRAGRCDNIGWHPLVPVRVTNRYQRSSPGPTRAEIRAEDLSYRFVTRTGTKAPPEPVLKAPRPEPVLMPPLVPVRNGTGS